MNLDYHLNGECADCGMHVRGLGTTNSDGKPLHLACAEGLGVAAGEELKVFEVEVRYSGRETVKVVARNEHEACELVSESDIDPFDFDIEADAADETNEKVTEDDVKKYQRRRQQINRAAERRLMKATLATKPSPATAGQVQS